MSYILYGETESGSGCWLNVTKVNHYKREAVYAGTDYVYTKHTVSVRALFNPGTQIEELPGKRLTYGQQPKHVRPPIDNARRDAANNPPMGPMRSTKLAPHGPGPARQDRPAIYTAEAAKHVLMQPRLAFHWWDGFQTILQVPLPGLSVDDNNGPRPISCDVAEQLSSKTWEVDWTVELCVNECPMFALRPHPVLSHQYGQTEDLDHDFYRTTTTEGEVIFSAAVVRSPDLIVGGQIAADDMRGQIVLPIPATMKRQTIQTRVSPDGLRLQYRVVDKEMGTGWTRAGVTRIEATHQVTNQIPKFEIDVKPLGIGMRLDLIKMAARGGQFERALADGLAGILPAGMGNRLGGLVGRWHDLGRKGLGLTTVATHVVQVKAWGMRGTQRNLLEDFIRQIIRERIQPLLVGFAPLTLTSDIQHDFAGTFVQGTEVYQTGPMFPAGSVLPSRDINGNRAFGNNNDTGNLLSEDPAFQIPGPPYDGYSRGTMVERLVSSALSRPCDPSANVPPTAPPATPKTVDLSPVLPPIWPRPSW